MADVATVPEPQVFAARYEISCLDRLHATVRARLAKATSRLEAAEEASDEMTALLYKVRVVELDWMLQRLDEEIEAHGPKLPANH